MESKGYTIPEVILDKAEEGDLIKIKKAYDKMLEPKVLGKSKAGKIRPLSRNLEGDVCHLAPTKGRIFVEDMSNRQK